MEGKRRRKWLQIHLSTAILMLFVTGVILWANICSENVSDYDDKLLTSHARDFVDAGGKTHEQYYVYQRHDFGWPFRVAIFNDMRQNLDGVTKENRQRYYVFQHGLSSIADNVILALLINIGVAFLSELYIRRCEFKR